MRRQTVSEAGRGCDVEMAWVDGQNGAIVRRCSSRLHESGARER